jgi:hypothetical protein
VQGGALPAVSWRPVQAEPARRCWRNDAFELDDEAVCLTGGGNGTIELQVRGSTHDPAAGTVTFRNVAGTRTYGTVTATPDPLDPQLGSYVFSVQSNGLGPCPSEIVGAFGTATTVGTVAVRD